ncbi:MAG: fasciclin domain-containing protein, partial [Pseudolabrys sp.]
MKRIINVTLAGVAATALALSLGASAPAFAQMKEKEKSVTVGGAPMYPSKNIVQNAVNSKDHTTLVAAVKA